MKLVSVILLLLLCTAPFAFSQEEGDAARNVHSFVMKDIDGNDVDLSNYAGNVLLLVNTASKCGFTKQYASLEELYRRFQDRGLRILAFPANNFGAQEPGSNAEIKEFCTSNFDVSFDLFSKISVKGDDIHPLYAYLTGDSPQPGELRWNFVKFLVDAEGTVIARYGTKVDPLDEQVIKEIEGLLNE
jgi:glutathione peroxidase-family protein